jgi:cell wall-associated NlpC family hydrolase
MLLLTSCKAQNYTYQARHPRNVPATTTAQAKQPKATPVSYTPVADAPAPPVNHSEVVALARMQQQIVEGARYYIGTPHRLGGMSRKGIDCSGLVQLSFQKAGVRVPRVTSQLAVTGKQVAVQEAQVGDLIFFSPPGKNKVSHVGIVAAVNGAQDLVFIHTSSSRGVREDNLYSPYWRDNFVQLRRVL